MYYCVSNWPDAFLGATCWGRKPRGVAFQFFTEEKITKRYQRDDVRFSPSTFFRDSCPSQAKPSLNACALPTLFFEAYNLPNIVRYMQLFVWRLDLDSSHLINVICYALL